MTHSAPLPLLKQKDGTSRPDCGIRPSVLINGMTYYPPGWVYILAFALAGCQWAIDALLKMEETPGSLRNRWNYMIEHGCPWEDNAGAFI